MVGLGYDSHRIERGKKLILGGVLVDETYGPVAHSDGDVVIHSLIDAILGALCLGDIGEHFPDTDDKYKNIDSTILLRKVVNILKERNKKIVNVDITIVYELKKITPYKQQIKNNIANICEIGVDKVNVKAKTNEKMGFIGRGEGIVALCVCEVV
jgi:2-C-methyl-D-erythritol 2,4-cyclodiphosphate synthase